MEARNRHTYKKREKITKKSRTRRSKINNIPKVKGTMNQPQIVHKLKTTNCRDYNLYNQLKSTWKIKDLFSI